MVKLLEILINGKIDIDIMLAFNMHFYVGFNLRAVSTFSSSFPPTNFLIAVNNRNYRNANKKTKQKM